MSTVAVVTHKATVACNYTVVSVPFFKLLHSADKKEKKQPLTFFHDLE